MYPVAHTVSEVGIRLTALTASRAVEERVAPRSVPLISQRSALIMLGCSTAATPGTRATAVA